MSQDSRTDGIRRAAVSVTEMARLVGLSRARFYELTKKGVFPTPIYDVRTRRPVYSADLQRICLLIRQSSIGWNSEYVVFNRLTCKSPANVPAASRKQRVKPDGPLDELTGAIVQLGLDVSREQIQAAVAELYPNGLPQCGGDEIRRVFCHLRRLNSA